MKNEMYNDQEEFINCFFSTSNTLPMLLIFICAAVFVLRFLYMIRMFSVLVNSIISVLKVFVWIQIYSMLDAYLLNYYISTCRLT